MAAWDVRAQSRDVDFYVDTYSAETVEAVEQEVAAAHGATFVSTSDWLCSPTECPVIVGDVLVYRDANHITATAATWLAPYLRVATAPLVA